MEWLLRACWVLIALVHVPPALVFFRPSMARTLYGAEPDGDVGLLIVHRGALFLAVAVGAIWAALDPASRRLAWLLCALSIMSFLWLYQRAGAPGGALRTIAIADLVLVVPLIVAGYAAWRPSPG